VLRAISLSDITLETALVSLDRCEQAETEARINEELAKLPVRYRDAVFAAAKVSEESCRTVARRYGVSPQTVCNWAKHAADQLRPALEDCQ